MNGMSLKQLSETAGCSYRTVKTHAHKLFPRVDFHGRRLTESEARAIMAKLPKRATVEARGNSAPSEVQNSTLPSEAHLSRLEALADKLFAIVAAIAPATQKAPAALALPAPPPLELRGEVKKAVEAWARRNGNDYHEAWSGLYREFRYRYHRNLAKEAENAGTTCVLDYAEAEDLLPELLALAYVIYPTCKEAF